MGLMCPLLKTVCLKNKCMMWSPNVVNEYDVFNQENNKVDKGDCLISMEKYMRKRGEK